MTPTPITRAIRAQWDECIPQALLSVDLWILAFTPEWQQRALWGCEP